MGVIARLFVIAFMLLGSESIPLVPLLSLASVSAVAQDDEDDEDEGDEDDWTTYESDSYGYTISYDDDWELSFEQFTEDVEQRVVESVGLSSRTTDAFAIFTGRAGNVAANDCVQGLARYWERERGNWNFTIADTQPREGDDEEPIAGGNDRDAFAVFDMEYEFGGDEDEGVLYARCQRFQSDEALLLTVIMYFDEDDYEDEEERREHLLDGVHLP